MSYCRSSSDDSNVYVFGSLEGWEIYVQASEQVDEALKFDPDDWESYWNNWRDFPHELRGKYYLCKTLDECLAKLLELRDAGILVPQRALTRLREEIKDNA